MGLGILQRTQDGLMKVGKVTMEQDRLILLRAQRGTQNVRGGIQACWLGT